MVPSTHPIKATIVAFTMVNRVPRSVFDNHPLGQPNTSSRCYTVETNAGKAHFAIGRYSQHADANIISITRMLYPSKQASHFLAIFRRWLRTHTAYLAAATWTDPAHSGTHLIADGWVYVANHKSKKRWIRTL